MPRRLYSEKEIFSSPSFFIHLLLAMINDFFQSLRSARFALKFLSSRATNISTYFESDDKSSLILISK